MRKRILLTLLLTFSLANVSFSRGIPQAEIVEDKASDTRECKPRDLFDKEQSDAKSFTPKENTNEAKSLKEQIKEMLIRHIYEKISELIGRLYDYYFK